MMIIYHYDSDSSFAATMVSAHLGFGGGASDELGRLVYQGTDALGHRVFTLARGDSGPVVELMLHGVAAAYRQPPDMVASVNLDRLAGADPRKVAARLLANLSEVPDRRVPSNSRPWPKVFYICYGSAHSSVVAAAIHAGLLPKTRPATRMEIASLRDFDHAGSDEIGKPVLIGRDEDGREIFALGLASARSFLHGTVHQLLHQLGLPPQAILTLDALKGVTWRTRLGGFLSRRLGAVSVGRGLCLTGLVQEYPRFLDLVSAARRRTAELARIDSAAALIDNNQEHRGEREEASDQETRGNYL